MNLPNLKTLVPLSLLIILGMPSCWYKQTPQDIIVDAPTITAIYNYLTPADYNHNTLIVMDIDNTILRPKTHLGSDEWFYAKVKDLEKNGYNHQEAIDHLLPTYMYIQDNVSVVPVECSTVPTIIDLQKKHITFIALTARSIDLAHRTVQQLRSIGIDFSAHQPHECPISYGDGKPALYIDGIIFVGNHDKGEVLINWLSQVKYKPKKVIFIDDKLKNIQSVERAVHAQDFSFIGIRYGQLDEYIKNIDLQKTDLEYKQMLKQYKHRKPVAHPISGGALL